MNIHQKISRFLKKEPNKCFQEDEPDDCKRVKELFKYYYGKYSGNFHLGPFYISPFADRNTHYISQSSDGNTYITVDGNKMILHIEDGHHWPAHAMTVEYTMEYQ